jgi:hypothetical protein
MTIITPTVEAAAKPHKKKRVFMWTFLAIQAIFVGLLIIYATEKTGPSHAEILRYCNGDIGGLYSSKASCIRDYGATLNAAGHVGQGLGAALVIGLWVAADIILGVGRLIVVLARRH